MLKTILFAVLFGAAMGCEEPVPDGRIRVKNDSLDSSYNIVKVVGGGVSRELAPHESVLLAKGATSFMMSRRYKDHTKWYQVQCPRNLAKGITIKMIDVHLNRIAGGCETTAGGKS
jgi:hypothetical protein